MHAQAHPHPAIRSLGGRRLAVAALSASLIALLAAIPTGSAVAAPATPGITLPASVTGLPVGEVEEVLSGIPLSNLNTTQLTELLAKLPALSSLLPKLGGLSGLEAVLKTAIGGLGGGATLGEITNPADLVPKLETKLNELIPLLGTLLGGNPTTKLAEALGSLNPSQLLGSLLGSATSPEQLIKQILTALSPEKLTALLGTTLTGESFSKTTVGELANSLGTTTETLAQDLGTTITQLPSTTMALTAPLTNGKLLGVLDGLEGVSLGLLGGAESKGSKETTKEGGKETNKETSKEGGSSENKETSGSSESKETSKENTASGTPTSGASVVVNNPLTEIAPVPPSTPGKSAAVDKIKILSHKVKGKIATLVVQVPAAGTATLKGSHVSEVSHQADKAERITLRVVLSRASVASLHKHHKRLKVALKASFEPVNGSSSSATVTVTFA